MKKTLIALFSVSITAGTTYLFYMQVKEFQIRKLFSSWRKEAEKQNRPKPDEEKLKKELEKLNPYDLWILSNYSDKFIQRSKDDEIKPLLAKVNKRKITERTDLKSLEGIIFGT